MIFYNLLILSASEYNVRDERVRETAFEIVSRLILYHDFAVIYTCDSDDRKEMARHRKFNGWFRLGNSNGKDTFEKHDATISVNIYTSLIIGSNNPLKELYKKAFYDEVDCYNNK